MMIDEAIAKEQYNKAVDDFVKLVKEHNWNIRNRNENEFIYGAIDTLAEQLKYYTKHIKLNSKDYKNKWIESKINQLKFYAYNERYKTNSNGDDVAEEFIDELQGGIKNNYNTDELIKKLKSIEEQREDVIKEYDKELALFYRTGDYLL